MHRISFEKANQNLGFAEIDKDHCTKKGGVNLTIQKRIIVKEGYNKLSNRVKLFKKVYCPHRLKKSQGIYPFAKKLSECLSLQSKRKYHWCPPNYKIIFGALPKYKIFQYCDIGNIKKINFLMGH